MTRQRYAWQESLNRILRSLRGEIPNSDQPGTLDGEFLSSNEVFSDLAELFQDSLPNESLSIPFGDVNVAPTGTSTPILGGWLYAQDGALMWVGSSGTITTIAGS